MKRTSLKVLTLDGEPYDTKIWVILGTPEQARKWKRKSVYSDVDYQFETSGASLCCEDYWPVMFINTVLDRKQRVQTFVHECIHIVNHIFTRCGVLSDDGNDEHYAYFMSYLVRQAQNKKII